MRGGLAEGHVLLVAEVALVDDSSIASTGLDHHGHAHDSKLV